MKTKLNKILIVTSLIFAVGCGGGGLNKGGGILQVVVKNAQSFNPNIEHGRIVAYQVMVTGEGIDTPITAEFSGDAVEGVIDGIPVGEERQVSVKAINPNSLTIKEGEKQNISIAGGKVTETEIDLQSVPIFTNIANGNTIENTRLVFRIFADPQSSVAVEEIGTEISSQIVDTKTSKTEVNLDISSGLGELAPQLQPPGVHTYKVSDVLTGRYSEITVNLVDGTKRRGAPFFAGGSVTDPALRTSLSSGTYLLPFLQ
jgi:stage V sporulation protein SpoVS